MSDEQSTHWLDEAEQLVVLGFTTLCTGFFRWARRVLNTDVYLHVHVGEEQDPGDGPHVARDSTSGKHETEKQGHG